MKATRSIMLLTIALFPLILFAGSELTIQSGYPYNVTAAAFLDANTIATLDETGQVIYWNAGTGREQRTLDLSNAYSSIAAVSPDGQWVINGNLVLYRFATGDSIRKFLPAPTTIQRLCFSPDGQRFLTVDDDLNMIIWNVANGRQLLTYKPDDAELLTECFYHSSNQMALGLSDGTIIDWNPEYGNYSHRWQCNTGATLLCTSPDDQYVYAATSDGNINVFCTMNDSDTLYTALEAQMPQIAAMQLSSDGKLLFVLSANGDLRVWDTDNFTETSGSYNFGGMPTCMAISTDHQKIVVGFSNGAITGWNVSDYDPFLHIDYQLVDPSAVVIAPDGRTLLSSTSTGLLAEWDLSRGQCLGIQLNQAQPLAISPDNQYYMSCAGDTTLYLNHLTTNVTERSYRNSSGSITTGVFSPDGRFFAALANLTAGYDSDTITGFESAVGSVVVWDVADGNQLYSHWQGSGAVKLIFSPDGRSLYTGGSNGLIHQWDVASGRDIRQFQCTPGLVFSMAISSDGQTLYTASDQISKSEFTASIEAWSTSSGQSLHKLSVDYAILNLSLSQDGRTAILSGASSNHDQLGLAQLDLEHWNSPAVLQEAGIESSAYAFFTNNLLGLFGSSDHGLALWDLSSSTPLATMYTFNDQQWLTTTAEGYFHASQNATNRINCSLNGQIQTATKAGRFRPDKVEAYLSPYFPAVSVPVVTPSIVTASPGSSVDDIALNLPPSTGPKSDAFAVVIGNTEYSRFSADVPNVDYAGNDAALMKRYLIESLGYKEGNILFVTDATLSKFNDLFGTRDHPRGRLGNMVKPGVSEVFVYYSGHGAPDLNQKQGYLVPVDGSPDNVSSTGYPLDLLYANLGKLGAKSLTVVIDACFSGGSGTGKMLIQAASPVGIRVTDPTVNWTNGALFTATGPGEIASWYPEKQHGLFTYFFLKGLQGAADADNDHKITADEMRTYLDSQNDGVPYWARRLFNGREQNPQFEGKAGMVLR